MRKLVTFICLILIASSCSNDSDSEEDDILEIINNQTYIPPSAQLLAMDNDDEPGQDAIVTLQIPGEFFGNVSSVGAHFLAVPPVYFISGDHTKPSFKPLCASLLSGLS